MVVFPLLFAPYSLHRITIKLHMIFYNVMLF